MSGEGVLIGVEFMLVLYQWYSTNVKRRLTGSIVWPDRLARWRRWVAEVREWCMIRLRQIVFAHPNLAEATSRLSELFNLGEPFADPGVAEFGLHNAVYSVGHQFVEIVSPTQPDTAVGRFLERNGGPGGYMLIFQTDRALADIRADLSSVRIVYEAVAPGVTGLHVHPRDTGVAIVSIDRTDDWDEWPWAGPDWRARRGSPLIDRVTSAVVKGDDDVIERWARLFGGRVETGVDGDHLRLDDDTSIEAIRGDDGPDRVIAYRFGLAAGAAQIDTMFGSVRLQAR